MELPSKTSPGSQESSVSLQRQPKEDGLRPSLMPERRWEDTVGLLRPVPVRTEQ